MSTYRKKINELNGASIDFVAEDECPNCNAKIVPFFIDYKFIENEDSSKNLILFFFCAGCKHPFAINYSIGMNELKSQYGYSYSTYRSTKESLTPFSPKVTFLPDFFSKISKRFVEIYKQAEIAEHYGLIDICGMGYRKALEFLVKDFLIKTKPEEEEEIIKEFLGKTIDRFDNGQLKTLASRAAWLGNDESHYQKLHTDKDLQDLKALLKGVIKYFELNDVFEEALSIKKKSAI